MSSETESEAARASDPTLHAEATEEGPVTRRVDVRIDARRVAQAFDRAYRDLAKQVRVKGFRPGKAPRSVLQKLYGASVAEEVERTLVQETLADAIERTDLAPVAPPAIDASTPVPDRDFSYVARVEVKPAIELGELEGLPARKPRVDVTEEEVQRELEHLRERNAPVVEEPEDVVVAPGHILSVDFVGRIDGAPFEGGTGRDVELEVGSGRFIPGFEDQLVGAAVGEDREVRVVFPEDYGNPELAGKEAVFDVHVAEVKRREMPELDDEFAKDVGEFETLEDLRERIRQDLLELRENQAKSVLRRTLMDALIDRTPFEVPAGMVEQALERQLRAAVQRLHGSVPEDALHEQVQRWREEWRASAEREVREALLLEAVVAAREIGVTDAEVEAHIEQLAQSQGVTPERLRQAAGEDSLVALARRQLADEKALDFLGAAAKVEETTDT
jgi:trigger factor